MNISNVVKDLILIDGFFGHFCLGIHKKFSNDIQLAAVTIDNINPVVMFNEEECNKLSHEYQIGLLWHELSHITHFHVCKSFWSQFQDLELLNIAEDLVINQYIPEKYLYPKLLKLNMFPQAKLPPFKSTKEYYDLLSNNLQSSSPDPNLQGIMQYMRMTRNHRYDHSPHREGQDGETDENGEGGNSSGSASSNLLQKQIEFQIKQTFEEHCDKSIGSLPSYLRDFVPTLYEKQKPVTDWRAAIRRFGSRCVSTRIKKSRRKLNIRFSDNPAVKVTPKKKMLVCIDTSGSISSVDFNMFFDQIDHMKHTGVNIDIMECDASVGRVYAYRDRTTIGKMTGGGGTAFNPALELLNKSRDYTAMCFFTDGYPCDAQKANFMKPVIWVITPYGTEDFKFNGPRVKMEKRL